MDRHFQVSSDIAFTPTVKAIQARKGSRRSYENVERHGGWRTDITEDLAGFIGEQSSVFLATANAAGQPCIQHRGGPPGFIRVLDSRTLAFADFSGNRQYISSGNLADNPQAYIFMIDYVHKRRVKLWGRSPRDRGRSGVAAQADARRGTRHGRAGDRVQDRGVGHQLPAAHPAKFDAANVAAAIGARDAKIAALEGGTGCIESPSSRPVRIAIPQRCPDQASFCQGCCG